jgi:hypothetical protein
VPLILGDVCCLFQVSNSRHVSIAGPSDGIQRIYLPLAHDCIVVGTSENEIDDVRVTDINEASAKVSRNYFISSVCSPDRAELSKLIATEADIMTPAEMEQILTEVMSESVSKKKDQPSHVPSPA